MLTKIKVAFAALALLNLASASTAAWASDNSSGHYHGGFAMMPSSMDGVNPIYRPDLFLTHANRSRAYGYASGRDAWASTKLAGHRHIPDSRNQFIAAQPAAHWNGRQIEAPPSSFACMTDHGPSNCREPMWVYGDIRP
jgi:hypothetical protein